MRQIESLVITWKMQRLRKTEKGAKKEAMKNEDSYDGIGGSYGESEPTKGKVPQTAARCLVNAT